MIRSLVGRGVRRVKGKKKPSGASASSSPSAAVATWKPPTATAEPAAAVAAAAAVDVLDWVDDAAAASAPSAAPTPEKPVSNGSSFAALAAAAAKGDLGKAVHADMGATDLDGYKARARALGKEIELAGEGMNTAVDGKEFWGPIDNESSRAKAVGLALTIDQHECISCGTCEENTDQVFLLPEAPAGQEEDKAEVLKQEGPMDLIQDAIDACPVTCIEWIPLEELNEAHSAGGVVAK
jgi:ferredoxin